MKKVIFDLDDFAEQPERNCLPQLIELKQQYPKLKVTLFSIPFYGGKDQSTFFTMVKKVYADWIQLAIHGWDHHSNFECSKWSYEEAYHRIMEAREIGCFIDGFKAPGWQISRETYWTLLDFGFWVADHKTSAYTEPGVLNKHRRPIDLKTYEINHSYMVHGHTWDCEGNGINDIINNVPWDDDTDFYFINELMNGEIK